MGIAKRRNELRRWEAIHRACCSCTCGLAQCYRYRDYCFAEWEKPTGKVVDDVRGGHTRGYVATGPFFSLFWFLTLVEMRRWKVKA